MDISAQAFIAKLMAHQWLPRTDPGAKRALTDESFRTEVDHRLTQCGLKLLENPYAEHVALGLLREMEQPAMMGSGGNWTPSSVGLDRDAIALLIILWALIILPKRQRQIERSELEDDPDQEMMFKSARKVKRGSEVSAPIRKKTLLADFGKKLGHSTRVRTNLGVLTRLGFIIQKQEEIHEGPLLDLSLDYNVLAPLILDGALTDLLGKHLADVLEKHNVQDEEDADV